MKHRNSWNNAISQKKMRENLDMGKEADKTVLQRKLYNNKDANKDLNKTNEPDSKVEESENMQNPDRIRNVLPVPHEETRQGGHEGITTHAVGAYSAYMLELHVKTLYNIN